ncbi:Uncharacterised protein [Bordetella pertussis]|nr:Uncharacterised protein [Bordetella pertussis]
MRTRQVSTGGSQVQEDWAWPSISVASAALAAICASP